MGKRCASNAWNTAAPTHSEHAERPKHLLEIGDRGGWKAAQGCQVPGAHLGKAVGKGQGAQRVQHACIVTTGKIFV